MGVSGSKSAGKTSQDVVIVVIVRGEVWWQLKRDSWRFLPGNWSHCSIYLGCFVDRA